MKHEESFNIGYVTKTKGLKGEIQIYFELDFYEQLDFDVLFADLNGKLVPFFVNSFKLYPNSTGLFYFDDVDHIDKAQALVKKKIFLPLTKMPELDDEEFTYHDLQGYLVTDKTFGELGEIVEVNEYPQQFVATMTYNEKEVLFPLNEDMIVTIDEEKNTLLVDLPEGLLSLYLEQQ